MNPTTVLNSYLGADSLFTLLLTYAPIGLMLFSAASAGKKALWIVALLVLRIGLAATGIAAAVFIWQSQTVLLYLPFLLNPAGILLAWLMYLRFRKSALPKTPDRLASPTS